MRASLQTILNPLETILDRRALPQGARNEAAIGAGTVVTTQLAETAIEAGAELFHFSFTGPECCTLHITEVVVWHIQRHGSREEA